MTPTERAAEVGKLIREAGIRAECKRIGKPYTPPAARETAEQELARLRACAGEPIAPLSTRLAENSWPTFPLPIPIREAA